MLAAVAHGKVREADGWWGEQQQPAATAAATAAAATQSKLFRSVITNSLTKNYEKVSWRRVPPVSITHQISLP